MVIRLALQSHHIHIHLHLHFMYIIHLLGGTFRPRPLLLHADKVAPHHFCNNIYDKAVRLMAHRYRLAPFTYGV
jgi:hypothetical protein